MKWGYSVTCIVTTMLIFSAFASSISSGSNSIEGSCAQGQCNTNSTGDIDVGLTMVQMKAHRKTDKEETDHDEGLKPGAFGHKSGDCDHTEEMMMMNHTDEMAVEAARKQIASCDSHKTIPGSSSWWSCKYDNMYTCGSGCCCGEGFSYKKGPGCIACPREVDKICAMDHNVCLGQSPGWSGYSCAASKSYCNEWNKDMWRCCSETCNVNAPCDLAACKKLGGKGTCAYPNWAQLCDYFTCPANKPVNKKGIPGGDSNTCCEAQGMCDAHTCPANHFKELGKKCPGNQASCDDTICCKGYCQGTINCGLMRMVPHENKSKLCTGTKETCDFSTCCRHRALCSSFDCAAKKRWVPTHGAGSDYRLATWDGTDGLMNDPTNPKCDGSDVNSCDESTCCVKKPMCMLEGVRCRGGYEYPSKFHMCPTDDPKSCTQAACCVEKITCKEAFANVSLRADRGSGEWKAPVGECPARRPAPASLRSPRTMWGPGYIKQCEFQKCDATMCCEPLGQCKDKNCYSGFQKKYKKCSGRKELCSIQECCDYYKSVGKGQCVSEDGILATRNSSEDIGWAKCSGKTDGFKKGGCGVTSCKIECSAYSDCAAFGYYNGNCILYRAMQKPYVGTNTHYTSYECFTNSRTTTSDKPLPIRGYP